MKAKVSRLPGLAAAVFSVMLFLSLTTDALAAIPAEQVSDVVNPGGEFAVYLGCQGGWQSRGVLAYNMHYREQQLSLAPLCNGEAPIVRLVETGVGAAHIDAVSLGARAPETVSGVDNGVPKMERVDFDVVDVTGVTLELAFPVTTGDATLRLTARAENPDAFKAPFLFPLVNSGHVMDEDASFYAYRIDSERGSLVPDGLLDEVSGREPFFREYAQTGTGHPAGNTYGWIRNDDQNLFVAMDFTPDNTADRGEDYATVFVKTEEGLREYAVSTGDTRWGMPGFVYTDRVGYQHKVYEFSLPLADILPTNRQRPDSIELAFSAYGTAAVSCITITQALSPPAAGPIIHYEGTLGQFELMGHNATQTSCILPAGNYTVSEAVPPGWQLTGIQCSSPTGLSTFITDLQTASVTIAFDPNESASCVFENQARPIPAPAMNPWGVACFAALAGLAALYQLRHRIGA